MYQYVTDNAMIISDEDEDKEQEVGTQSPISIKDVEAIYKGKEKATNYTFCISNEEDD